MKHWKCLLLCSLLGSAALQAEAACYTVFDRSNRIVYYDAIPPVDMERPFHETVPLRFPGGHMVFSDGACLPLSGVMPAAPTGRAPPLLTDRQTAQAMGVPYRVISGEIVIVQQGHAPVRPAVTVVPPQARTESIAKPSTVITELHDPPMTIVQSSQGVAVSELSR